MFSQHHSILQSTSCSLSPVSLFPDAFPSQRLWGDSSLTHSHIGIIENRARPRLSPFHVHVQQILLNVLRSVPFPCWCELIFTFRLPTHDEPSHRTENLTSGCLVCSGDSEVMCIGCVLSRAQERAVVLATVRGSLVSDLKILPFIAVTAWPACWNQDIPDSPLAPEPSSSK